MPAIVSASAGRRSLLSGGNANRITYCTDNGVGVVVETVADHKLATGQTVVLAGTGLYDGTWTITVDKRRTFVIDAVFAEVTAGGTWRLA